MSPVISVLPSKGPLVLLLPSLGDNQVTVSSAVDEGMSQEPLWTGMSSGGFRAGGFAATSCPWIRRFPTSFQRDWLCLVQPSYFSVTRSCWGGGAAAGVEVRGVGGGTGCSDVAFASTLFLLCHGNIMEKNPFFSAISGSPSVSHTGHV